MNICIYQGFLGLPTGSRTPIKRLEVSCTIHYTIGRYDIWKSCRWIVYLLLRDLSNIYLMVTNTRFELVNGGLRGHCVRPLHQFAIFGHDSGDRTRKLQLEGLVTLPVCLCRDISSWWTAHFIKLFMFPFAHLPMLLSPFWVLPTLIRNTKAVPHTPLPQHFQTPPRC